MATTDAELLFEDDIINDLFCMCMSVDTSVCMWAHVWGTRSHLCVWRTEEDSGSLPQWLLTYFAEAGSLIEPEPVQELALRFSSLPPSHWDYYSSAASTLFVQPSFWSQLSSINANCKDLLEPDICDVEPFLNRVPLGVDLPRVQAMWTVRPILLGLN